MYSRKKTVTLSDEKHLITHQVPFFIWGPVPLTESEAEFEEEFRKLPKFGVFWQTCKAKDGLGDICATVTCNKILKFSAKSSVIISTRLMADIPTGYELGLCSETRQAPRTNNDVEIHLLSSHTRGPVRSEIILHIFNNSDTPLGLNTLSPYLRIRFFKDDERRDKRNERNECNDEQNGEVSRDPRAPPFRVSPVSIHRIPAVKLTE